MIDNDLDLQRHSAIQDARISNLETKFEMFMNSLQDFKNEMRDRDNQRHAEIAAINQQNAEIRQSIREIYQTTDAKIADIKNSVDGIAKHVQNFSIAAFVGIGAMVVTSVIGIAAMVWAVIPKG